MQHERLFALTRQTVDDLCIASRSQCGNDQCCCVSPRVNSAEPCVRASTARSNVDAAHGFRVAAVDARMTFQYPLAHQTIFEVEEFTADLVGGELRRGAARVGFGQRFQPSQL